MTPRQKHCLTFISTFIDMNGYSPTIGEISRAMGLVSRTGAAQYLDRLEAAGYLKRSTECARNIRVCDPSNKNVAISDLHKAASELIASKITSNGGSVVVKNDAFRNLERMLS